jgi:hypothetical protein
MNNQRAMGAYEKLNHGVKEADLLPPEKRTSYYHLGWQQSGWEHWA